jgi:hypothetical protein
MYGDLDISCVFFLKKNYHVSLQFFFPSGAKLKKKNRLTERRISMI